jgi:2,3-bisphosphoglycerate-independent phosphoglycerate mutase
MKYIILVGDGMAGKPLKKLGFKTCLQKAHTPNMDWLATAGQVGLARTVPHGYEPGSDVANLSILGYSPAKYYSGRAPIEAEYRGIKLGDKDVAFRCNLVTLDFPKTGGKEKAVMQDYSAGHITTKESSILIKDINKKLGSREIIFYPGMSYRHLMVWKNGRDKLQCTPPHDITGKTITAYMPSGQGSDVINSLIQRSTEILLANKVNQNRIKNKINPANSIWLWGQGKRIPLPSFKSTHGLKGAMISAVDLTKGLGIGAGFDIINVKGATGYIDTNYIGKARAALRALKDHDILYVHVEAPDEAGHNGKVNDKLQAIEDFDEKVVGTILKSAGTYGEHSILLMPDHFTPISVRTHTKEPVPFVIYRSTMDRKAKGSKVRKYSESISRMKDILVFEEGHKLMDYFLMKKPLI